MGPEDKSKFSVEALKRAVLSLGDALLPPPANKRERDGAIQRFEYTFELSWKTLKKYFEVNNNLQEDNVKNLFREAGKQGLIENVENWFSYQKARNSTSHNYNDSSAEYVFEKASEFYADVQKLLNKLESLT